MQKLEFKDITGWDAKEIDAKISKHKEGYIAKFPSNSKQYIKIKYTEELWKVISLLK